MKKLKHIYLFKSGKFIRKRLRQLNAYNPLVHINHRVKYNHAPIKRYKINPRSSKTYSKKQLREWVKNVQYALRYKKEMSDNKIKLKGGGEGNFWEH